MQWSRQHSYLALGLVLALLLAYGFWPRAVPVDVATVQHAPLAVTLEEEGKTRLMDRFILSAPIAGYLRRPQLEVGDSVQRDQTLLELEPLPSPALDPRSRAQAESRVGAARSALEAARAEAKAARAEAEFAAREHQRLQALCAQGCVSEEEKDAAAARARSSQALLGSAEFAVEVARHELEAAETALRYAAARETGQPLEQLSLKSPVDGRVLRLYQENEGVVGAAQPLLELGDPGALEVEVDVLSTDAVKIQPGMRVLFDRWGGDEPLEGRVRLIEPVGFTKVSALGVEEQRVLVIADIVSPPEQWQRLGDGYRVEARFILWSAEQVLQLPASALFRHGEGWAVFSLENGRAVRHAVEVGRRNGLAAQLLSGLEAGATVITHPDDSIEDGVRVVPR